MSSPTPLLPESDDDRQPPQAARLAPKLRALAEKGIYFGTSSWKYEGWLGSIYTEARYQTRGKLSQKKFDDTCLAEYARIFPTVCGDFAFYVRRVVFRCIPASKEEFLGQWDWVIRLTYGRKARGTTACRKSGGRPESTKVEPRKTRAAWPRLHCLKSNPDRPKRRPIATLTRNDARTCRPIDRSGRQVRVRGYRAIQPGRRDEWTA